MALDDLVDRRNKGKWPSAYKWPRLANMVEGIKAAPDQYGYSEHFKAFEEILMNSTSWIPDLYNAGWGVSFKKLGKNYAGKVHPERKKIVIDKNITGFMRDETIIHELLHAYFYISFGSILPDVRPNKKHKRLTKSGMEQKRNSAVVDYISRKLRANPKILRAALDTYGIDLNVYDEPSARASVGYKWHNKEVKMD